MFLEDAATTITEVAFAHNGNWVTFVHDHTNGTIDEGVTAHIHRFQLGSFTLEDVVALPDVVPTGLIASEQSDGTIAWQQPYSTVSTPTFTWTGGDPRAIGFPETIADPVGFFDGGTTATVVFPVGGAESPGTTVAVSSRRRSGADRPRRHRSSDEDGASSDVERPADSYRPTSRRLMTLPRTGRCDERTPRPGSARLR